MEDHIKFRNSVVGCSMCLCEILPPSVYFICGVCPDGIHTVCQKCHTQACSEDGHIFFSEIIPFCRDNQAVISNGSFGLRVFHIFKLFHERRCLGTRLVKGMLQDRFKWFTYSEVLCFCSNVLHFLNSLCVDPKQPVLVCADSCVETYVVLFALNIGGYLSVPINHNATNDYVKGVLNKCDVQVAFVSRHSIGVLETTLSVVKTIILIDDCVDAFTNIKQPTNHYKSLSSIIETKATELTPPTNIDDDNIPLLLLSTSGSTGNPKLVVETAGTLKKSLTRTYGHVQNIVVSFTLIRQPFDILSKGGSIACYSGSMERLREDILLVRPTFFAATPTFWNSIYQEFQMQTKGMLKEEAIEFFKKKNVLGNRCRKVLVTGAKSSAEVKHFLFDLGLILTDGYGTSETGSLVNMTTGAANSGVVLKLVECSEMGYSLSDNPPRGEVVAKTQRMSSGYYGDKELTEQMFVTIEGNVFFKTGDIGEIVDGCVRIIDRKAFCFKTSQGCFVTPSVVESALEGCLGIEQLVVFGGIDMDCVVAVVVLKEGVEMKSVFEEVKKKGRVSLKEYEIPSRLIVAKESFSVANGFLTPNRKINRQNIIRHFKQIAVSSSTNIVKEETFGEVEESNSNSTSSCVVSKELEELIRGFVKAVEHVKDFSSVCEYRLTDFGADSIVLAQLCKAIEQKFGVEVSIQTLYKLRCINQLQLYLNGMPLIEDIIDWSSEIEKATRKEVFVENSKEDGVLLFGSTGFVSKFVLRELYGKKVVCIVRGENCQERLWAILQETIQQEKISQYSSWFHQNVRVLQGDSSEHEFGLSHSQYKQLMTEINVVIAGSGNTNKLEPYEMLYSPNVLSVVRAIEFCQKTNSVLLQISSLSFLSGTGVKDERIDIPLVAINKLNGYAQSKLVAEKAIIHSTNFKRVIIRLGTAGPDRISGISNPSNKYSKMFKTILRSEKVCFDFDSPLQQFIPYIPIDYFSHFIVSLVERKDELKEDISCFNVSFEEFTSLQHVLSKTSLKQVSSSEMFEIVGKNENIPLDVQIPETTKIQNFFGHVPQYTTEECQRFLAWIKTNM